MAEKTFSAFDSDGNKIRVVETLALASVVSQGSNSHTAHTSFYRLPESHGFLLHDGTVCLKVSNSRYIRLESPMVIVPIGGKHTSMDVYPVDLDIELVVKAATAVSAVEPSLDSFVSALAGWRKRLLKLKPSAAISIICQLTEVSKKRAALILERLEKESADESEPVQDQH